MFDVRVRVVLTRLIVVLGRASVLVAALLVSACAAKGTHTYAEPEYRVASPSARVAGYRQDVGRVDLEDDGLAAQAAPMRRRKIQPDDPREPYSQHYGSVPAVAAVEGDGADVDVGTGGYDPFLDGPQWDMYKQKARADAAYEARRAIVRERVGPVAFVQRAGSHR